MLLGHATNPAEIVVVVIDMVSWRMTSQCFTVIITTWHRSTIATHFSVAWSVSQSVVCHIQCTLLKVFNEFRLNLIFTFIKFNYTVCSMGVLHPTGEGKISGQTHRTQSMQLLLTYEKKQFMIHQ